MENVLEHFAGDPAKRSGLRITIAQGPDGGALDAFYKAPVPAKGAIFAADGFTLYRASGTPGSRKATLVEGCGETPPKARLVHVQWIALREGAVDPTAT